MEVVKQRLAAIRNEENDLRDKSLALDGEIRSAKTNNDKIQIELQGLLSREKLLKLKIDQTAKRLGKVSEMLTNQEQFASCHEKKLESLTAAREKFSDKEESLEAQLLEAREQSRKIQAEYDETLIHLQHIEEAKRKKLAQAELVEKQVEALEQQQSALKSAWDNVEVTDPYGVAIDDLESQLKALQMKLDAVNDTYENSERELSRLDRRISGIQQDLRKQQTENDSLRKELDGIFHELQNI